MSDEPEVPPANAVHCLDCGGIYEGREDCPIDGHVAIEAVYVQSWEPLGRSDDDDAILGRTTRWAYHVGHQCALRAPKAVKARRRAKPKPQAST